MTKATIVHLEPKEVWFVRTKDIPAGCTPAFEEIEGYFPNIKRRKLYGVSSYDENNPEYWACIEVEDEDEFSGKGPECGVLAGGRYARLKIRNWAQGDGPTGAIRAAFSALGAMFVIDTTRPSVEFYRSHTELFVMVPIEASNPASDA